MGDLQRLSPCGRVEPEAYAGRKIRHLNFNSSNFRFEYDKMEHTRRI